ncbi:hypothetical protein BC831DRAFT_487003 [Entophlyctis helioformis]|nr:hypothetical protein BC831DRAFT_487003 [Entophlyctis helioformis]
MDANLVADEEARVPSDQESLRLALDLDRVAEIVAAATLEPSLLVRHVIGIAREASSLYYSLRVKDIPPDIAVGRMRFWRAVRIVLQQLMLLLAVHPLAEDEY